MNKNIEKIDGYLKGVALPEHVSEQHRRTLRQQILNRIERKQIMFVRNRTWKVAAVIALICMGVVTATVVGIKYHYIKQDEKGRHFVQSEDGTNTFVFAESHADSPEQAVAYAEELTLLKQQGDRELVGVTEIEVNGQHDSRSLAYEYNLSDGQTRRVYESDTDDTGPRTLVGERLDEALQLFREIISTDIVRAETDGQSVKIIYLTADGQEIETYEKVVHGRLFSFKTRRFTLSDGTEVAWSIGDLKENQ